MPFIVDGVPAAAGSTVDMLFVTEGDAVAHVIGWVPPPSFVFSEAAMEDDTPNAGITLVAAAVSTITGAYKDEFPITSITWTKPQQTDGDGNPMSIETDSLPGIDEEGNVVEATWANMPPDAEIRELKEFRPTTVTHVLHTYTLTVDSVHSVSGAKLSEELTLLETDMMSYAGHATSLRVYV